VLTLTTEIDNKTIEQLIKWKCHSEPFAPCYSRESGNLAQGKLREESKLALELYRRLLELRIADSYLPTLNAHLSSRHCNPEHSEGEIIPILRFEDLLQDWALLQELFREASSIISEYFPSDGSNLEKIAPELLKKTAKAWYHCSSLHSIANEIGVARGPLSLCLKAAFHPVLVNYSEALLCLVNQDSWRRGICPICGGKPDFAFLSKDSGARWLVCSRCDTEWLFFRLECPFCGNRDQESLAYLTDEKDLYRLYTCEKCGNYIKAIDLRHAGDNILFPLERILTLDLDRQAHEAGYEPGWTTIEPA
jgi:hypothetical protein